MIAYYYPYPNCLFCSHYKPELDKGVELCMWHDEDCELLALSTQLIIAG